MARVGCAWDAVGQKKQIMLLPPGHVGHGNGKGVQADLLLASALSSLRSAHLNHSQPIFLLCIA